MTEGISKFFSLKPETKLRNFYFKENAEGQICFYPWGYPGEGYKVNQEQKSKLLTYIYTMFFMLILPTVGIFLYCSNSSQGLFDANWVIVPSITSYLIIHCIGNWFLVKGLEPDGAARTGKPIGYPIKLVKFLLALGVLQFSYGILGLYYNPESLLLKGASIFVIILYSLLIFVALHSKGYIFQTSQQ